MTHLLPLHERLLELEHEWQREDERFARQLEAGLASLESALAQTRIFLEHSAVLARELAMLPSLRVALVREGVWTTDEAYASCTRYPANASGHFLELLPWLPDEAVDALVEHTRRPEWRRSSVDHVGVWVTGRGGGDTLLVRLCARLLERGERSRAVTLFETIEHEGARVDALEVLRGASSEAAFVGWRSELRERCRRLDPIRRHYALCELSRLYPEAEALACVEEGIAGLPSGHAWTHAPGGLMLMLLAEPVVDALDRDGLRDRLVALAEREGESFSGNLTGDRDARLAALLGRPHEAPDGLPSFEPSALDAAARGELGPLVMGHRSIPDALLGPAIAHLRAAVARDPAQPWPMLVLLRLAARAGDPSALAWVAEHVELVEWHRLTVPEPIWTHAELDRLPRDVRERLLTKAVERLRASARPRLESDVYVLGRLLDEEPPEASADPRLAARWLEGARFGAESSEARDRWNVAARLWGRAGLVELHDCMRATIG